MGLADSKNSLEKKTPLKKTSTLLFFSEGVTLTSCGKMMRGVGLFWQRRGGEGWT